VDLWNEFLILVFGFGHLHNKKVLDNYMRLLLRGGVHLPTQQIKQRQQRRRRRHHHHHHHQKASSSSFCVCLSSSTNSNNFIYKLRQQRRIRSSSSPSFRIVSTTVASSSSSSSSEGSGGSDNNSKITSKTTTTMDALLECLNESTKFVVSATAMLFLLFHPTVETCWCLLGSIVNSVNGKLLKRMLNHSRPDGAKKVDPGMPSSHATSLSYLSWYAALAFAFEPNAFGLTTNVTRALAAGLVSLGTFLAYLRVKLGFHTWPQVLVGYGLGSSTALVWILFGKRFLIQHLAEHPERLRNLHACLVIAIGLFALSAIKWVKELVKSSSSSTTGKTTKIA